MKDMPIQRLDLADPTRRIQWHVGLCMSGLKVEDHAGLLVYDGCKNVTYIDATGELTFGSRAQGPLKGETLGAITRPTYPVEGLEERLRYYHSLHPFTEESARLGTFTLFGELPTVAAREDLEMAFHDGTVLGDEPSFIGKSSGIERPALPHWGSPLCQLIEQTWDRAWVA